MSYYNKYIEYKNKYLKLKNQFGGNNITINVRNNNETKQYNVPVNTSIMKLKTYILKNTKLNVLNNMMTIVCADEKSINLTDDCLLTNDHNNETIRVQEKPITEEIKRFVDAQKYGAGGGNTYNQAMNELKEGEKKGHWIWYCLPNIKNKYQSTRNAQFFAIKDFYEAIYYISDDILRKRLIDMLQIIYDEISTQIREDDTQTDKMILEEMKRHSELMNDDICKLMGTNVDVKKLVSCVTLFYYVFEYTKMEGFTLLKNMKDMFEKYLYKKYKDNFTYDIIKEQYNHNL
jgi:uncharacterized protein (DUF1810 family)